jgi:hypothetical protein
LGFGIEGRASPERGLFIGGDKVCCNNVTPAQKMDWRCIATEAEPSRKRYDPTL